MDAPARKVRPQAVLFVCGRNSVRSPMAAALFKHLFGRTTYVASAGVRHGEGVERGMIAAPIGPDMRMAVVASPDYFKRRGKPKTPKDLNGHNCVNLRLPTEAV